jgi:hypothetical protein
MTDEEIQGNLALSEPPPPANRGAREHHARERVPPAPPNANPQTSQRPMARIRAINDWITYAARMATSTPITLGDD